MAESPPAPVVAGLVILGLLSVLDVLSPAIFPTPGPGEPGPPQWIVGLGVVIGLVSLALIGLLVRRGDRGAAIGLVVLRVLSALSAVPAFFEPGVPGWIVTTVAAFIVLTGVGCVLIAPTLRGRQVAQP